MNKDLLLAAGYKRYEQLNGEPTLYQFKVSVKEGVRYFINCYHYHFPERDSWEFRMQTESDLGIINTTLFNTDITIPKLETFMRNVWVNYGSNYYEKFANVLEGERNG